MKCLLVFHMLLGQSNSRMYLHPLGRLLHTKGKIAAGNRTCARGSLLRQLDSHFNELCQVWICVEVALCPSARFLCDVNANEIPPRNGGTKQAVDQVSTAANVQASDWTCEELTGWLPSGTKLHSMQS